MHELQYAGRLKGLLEAADTQNVIIKMQSDIIDGLFCLLLQHVSAEDEGLSDILDDMATAAGLRKGISGPS